MNNAKIAALSRELLMRYYDNDISCFLDNLDENALWYGPAAGQFLQGRQAMISAWAEEDNPLTFTMGNIRMDTISSGPSMCVVASHFSVITHYPSGNDLALEQRVVLTWCERSHTDAEGKRRRVPRILVCDITNPHPKSADDTIYPVHFEQVFGGFTQTPIPSERMHFKGTGSTEYFLYSNSILWGDSSDRGRRTLLHLADGTTAEVTASVRDIVNAHPTAFLRCHASHFVNPNHVKSLRRFAVTMPGDQELPIPEKHYTAFKRALAEALGSKSDQGGKRPAPGDP